MEQEDILKTLESLGKSGLNVAGDFVLNKHVEYEVNNVEAGGTGIVNNFYNEKSKKTATDEQISRGITAINGNDKALNHQQGFLGICICLASTQGWPSDFKLAVDRINQLPDAAKWNIPCKYESIRKIAVYKFARLDYSEWDNYTPKESERKIFLECRDAARAFEEQLKIEMQG